MEQKDYLQREIEKIGLLLKVIFDKLVCKGENSAIIINEQYKAEKGMLLLETGFDLDQFLSLRIPEIESYILKFSGMHGQNIELLADILKVTGMQSGTQTQKMYLERALKLYEMCNLTDKTFSFDRENKISEIKNHLI